MGSKMIVFVFSGSKIRKKNSKNFEKNRFFAKIGKLTLAAAVV